MKFTFNQKKKYTSVYFILVTLLFLIGIYCLPDTIFSYTPIYYIFFGPVALYILNFKYSENLNNYIDLNYPDLFKKYARNHGALKGDVMDLFTLYQTPKDYLSINDPVLNEKIFIAKHVFKLFLFSFLALITVSILGYSIR
jgi:Na+/proline symporter